MLAASPRYAVAAARAGQVEQAQGECFAREAATRRALAPPAAVFVGDLVGTGADAVLGMHLGVATRVMLGPETQLRIDRFVVNAGGILRLDRGAMLYDHDPADGSGDVAVRSPFGLLAVRGTRFYAGPSNGPFSVFVERGEVQVVGVASSFRLTEGQGTNIAAIGLEPAAPTQWGAARIAAVMAQFKR